MKKLCEKHSLLVGALITLFIAIILSWIFPEAYYSNGKLGLSHAEKFGLFASTANDTSVGGTSISLNVPDILSFPPMDASPNPICA